MRIAVLADVHGNLLAAEAVLDDIRQHSPDTIVAAGDLCLRGSHPAETFDLLQSHCQLMLMGNTDAYLIGNYLTGAYCNRNHWKTNLLHWTRAQLGPRRLSALALLPFSTRFSPRRKQDLFICHANPRNLEESLEPTLGEDALRSYLAFLDAAVVAVGHIHFPYRRRLGNVLVTNIASAGIPRDDDLRAAWGLFTWTPRGWRVQIRRVRYLVRNATQLFTERRVPGAAMLIQRMLEARYSHHELLAEAAQRHSKPT